jgi:hypothetical protein
VLAPPSSPLSSPPLPLSPSSLNAHVHPNIQPSNPRQHNPQQQAFIFVGLLYLLLSKKGADYHSNTSELTRLKTALEREREHRYGNATWQQQRGGAISAHITFAPTYPQHNINIHRKPP